jgi:hypothetical protein
VITETQSCAYDIRDTFFNAVSKDPFFAGWTAKRNRMLPIQPPQLPYLGVYLVDEVLSPDGDANCGMICFEHVARVGFSAVVQNNDQDAAAQLSDQAFLKIMTVLYTDPYIMNVLKNYNAEHVGIEAIVGGKRRHIYGTAGLNNETPFLEMQYEAGCHFKSEWFPDITDTLNEIDVTTRINNNQNIIPIQTVYTLTGARTFRSTNTLPKPEQIN